ncbi:MAG: RluA family pseudouridine synthase [Ilumatobacteraceae bacterium]
MPTNDVLTEQIPEALAGERLDRVVAMIAEISRSTAAALIANSGVRVDGEVVSVGKGRLLLGQTVTVDQGLIPRAERPQPDEAVQFEVVYEDDAVIVVNKPAGLVVHPGAGRPDGTLVNGLLARFPELAEVGQVHRPGIVHRLDSGTSGLLIVARRMEVYESLVAMMADREVHRHYLALVWGRLDAPVGTIDAPIGRDPRSPLRMAVVSAGKPARTGYSEIRRFDQPEVTLVACELETGRTHQIRVHLQAIGHPVVGDSVYGGSRASLRMDRPFLHADRLAFRHPVTGLALEFECPLPADLTEVLARCQ